MKKFGISFIVLFCWLASLSAEVKVGILNGPSCIPAAYIMDNVVSIQNEELTFTKYADAVTLVPKILKNEIDIGFLPVNVAAKLYNSTKKSIICGAVVGEGNISLITKDTSISGFDDLLNKTVYVAGAGATPDFLFKYLLSSNNIPFGNFDENNNSVILDFSIPTAQLAAQLISGKIEYAVVPEPFTTIACMTDKNVFAAIDFQKEYSLITGKKNYPLTVMVINRDFAEKNTDVVNNFIDLYNESVTYTLDYGFEVGQLCEKYELGLKADVVAQAIPYANYVFSRASQEKERIEQFLTIFMNANSSSIGGKLPDEDFYY